MKLEDEIYRVAFCGVSKVLLHVSKWEPGRRKYEGVFGEVWFNDGGNYSVIPVQSCLADIDSLLKQRLIDLWWHVEKEDGVEYPNVYLFGRATTARDIAKQKRA